MIEAMTADPRWSRIRWWEWIGLVAVGALLVIYSPRFADVVSHQARMLAWVTAGLSLGIRPIVNRGDKLAMNRLPIVEAANSTWGALLTVNAFYSFSPAESWSVYGGRLGVTGAVAWVGYTLERLSRDNRVKQRLLHDARDEALRLKLAPHFLFNALNTMKAQIAGDPQGAATTADRLAALLRQVLDGSGRLTVPLREELAFVESYLGIERIRLGDRLRVKLEIPEAAEGMAVPPLSLQALVENAVKHGIAPREAGGEIRIWARTEPCGTREKVWVGVESPLSEGGQAGPGVGLETLRARLRDPADLVLGRDDGLFRAKFGWIDEREPASA